MSAYFVANIRIHDQLTFDKYVSSVDEVYRLPGAHCDFILVKGP